MKPQIAIEDNEQKSKYRKQEVLNKLKYVEIKVGDEKVQPPPPGVEINIDM